MVIKTSKLLQTYLLLQWLHVVLVDVTIADRVHELAGLQAAHMGDHVREQRVAGDVEWNAQALVMVVR